MRYEVAEHLISQLIELCRSKRHKVLTLIWHGGEPLLWGIDNYRQIFHFAQEIGKDICIKQCIQTNLSLINDEYINLFKEYNVKVGFSLDGPRQINDAQRLTSKGEGTFDTIIEKVNKCREAGLNIGCILVGSKNFVGHIPQVYKFLCKHKLNFKFNPLFEAGEALIGGKSIAITTDEYAQMAIELFDLWYYDTENNLKETTFIDIASYFVSRSKSSRSCIFSTNCQDKFMAVSPTGEVFPCGRFCETDTRYSYGNITKDPLGTIIENKKESEIYNRGKQIENSSCSKCRYYQLCYGGCLHDGFLAKGDFMSKTFLCGAYKQIFAHIEKCVAHLKKEA